VTEDPDDDHLVEIIFCGGGAKPTDTHLASTVHCIDEIIEWLERRERRRRGRSSQIEKVRLTPIYSAFICSCSILQSH